MAWAREFICPLTRQRKRQGLSKKPGRRNQKRALLGLLMGEPSQKVPGLGGLRGLFRKVGGHPRPPAHHLSKGWRVNENSHPQRKIFIHLMAETKCHLCCDNKRFKVHYCRFSIHLWSGSRVRWCNSPCNPLNGKKLGSKCQMDAHNIISGKTSIFLHPLCAPPFQNLPKC